MRLLYTFLLYLIQPFAWIRLLWRSRKAPDYRKRWLERYGFCGGKVSPNGILLHSVSVGETIAAIPLINALQIRYPDLPITVTTMTPTGSKQVIKSLGESVYHVYLPYDLPCALNRFLTILQPKIVIIMETELWPNLITALHKRNIPLIVANARLSECSAKRYAKLGHSIEHILTKITHIAAQNPIDGERFIKLGFPKHQLTITGSIKFDIQLGKTINQQITTLKSQWQLNRLVWIAASTHQGEDEILLAAHQLLLKEDPNLLLIIVPRHPERFKAVEKLIIDQKFNYQRRSQNLIPTAQTQVILGDTMGELLLLYGMADIAFVGGSLIKHGGHNPLEPALHHLPIVMGEHVFNFKVICDQLANENALLFTSSDDFNLYDKINDLLRNPNIRYAMGENAYQVLKHNQGALKRLLTIIESIFNQKT